MKRGLLLAVLVLALLPVTGCVSVNDARDRYISHNHKADYKPWWASEDLPRGGDRQFMKSKPDIYDPIAAVLYIVGDLIFRDR